MKPAAPLSIIALADDLPEQNITTLLLQGLDFIMPGEWNNPRGFDNMIQQFSGLHDPAQVAGIRQKALEHYNDPTCGYAKAMNVYRLVDKADIALGTAALANKVGQRISFLSFLHRFTPKADTTQAIDLAVKLAAEAIGFGLLKGLKHQDLNAFAAALADYAGASKLRLAALVCVDGIIPLGPDFVQAVSGLLGRTRPAELLDNPVFSRLSSLIPGQNTGAQLSFLQGTLDSAGNWINGFVRQHDLTRDKVVGSIGQFIELSDDVLDYLGAFLDASTNYVEHTGIQTISQAVIEASL
ncbi:MAG: hypothetical protein AB1894_02370 [Chloroflexota bacterium]